MSEKEPNDLEDFYDEYTPNFILLKESMEFEIYFALFFIIFGVFLSYMFLLTRNTKIIKLEKKKSDTDIRLKKIISISMLILISIRLLRILYFNSYFNQMDLFIYFFIEIIKFINITLIPFILKEQIRKNIHIPFKKTFIFFWILIFLNSVYDIYLEFFFDLFFEVFTFSILNFLCSSVLLYLFIKNPVKNYITTNDYSCYLIELENKFPEAVRKIFDVNNNNLRYSNKSKTASPKRRIKFSEFKNNKDNSLILKEVTDFKIIKNEDIKINPYILINELKENFYYSSFNHSENLIFNTLNESFENTTNVNNTKVTFCPKIEINFKDNYIFSLNKNNNSKETKNAKLKKNNSSDFDSKVLGSYSNSNHINSNMGNNAFNSNKNTNIIFTNVINNSIVRCNIINNNNNIISNENNCINKNINNKNNAVYSINNQNRVNYISNIFNKNNSNNIFQTQKNDETKKAIFDVVAKFYFVFTVQVKELQIKNTIKKSMKDFFELENSLKNEFLYSNNKYIKKIQDKLPRLKFPKKLKQKNFDFFKTYSINFQIFLKSIINEACFVTDDVLKFLNLSNFENLKNYFKNYRMKQINYLRFNDDTINNERYQSFISASFYEEKVHHENEEEENINNIYSNFSTTTLENFYSIKKTKKNIFDNSQIKNSESIILNNYTITSGFNNAFSTNNFYNSNTQKFNNFNFSKTNDQYYCNVNYKIKVDEINIFSNFHNNNLINNCFSNNNTILNLNGTNSNNNYYINNNTIAHNTSAVNCNFSKRESSSNIPNINNFVNNKCNNNHNTSNINNNSNYSFNQNNNQFNNNNNSNANITMINANLNTLNNSNQNISINININTNVNFNSMPSIGLNKETIPLHGLNCLNYNICLNNNLISKTNPHQTGIASPLIIYPSINNNLNNNNKTVIINNNNTYNEVREGEIIINVSYNYIFKIIKKKFSDFKRLIHEVSEVNKNNENIKLLNKLLKSEEIIINNNLYNLCDTVIQNIFDNLNTIYKNEILINEFFHEFLEYSFSYSRGLSINSNYYDCSKKFIHYHRLYIDGKIISIKGEVKDIFIIVLDFKTNNFYMISLCFDLSILISGFRQEDCFLKYKYKELMDYIFFMRNELGMPKIQFKDFKNEKVRKKEMKIAELDLQLKDLLNNKDFVKKEKWLEIFNMDKCYRQIKDYNNRNKSSFTSYPSFISISRDSLQNMNDI